MPTVKTSWTTRPCKRYAHLDFFFSDCYSLVVFCPAGQITRITSRLCRRDSPRIRLQTAFMLILPPTTGLTHIVDTFHPLFAVLSPEDALYCLPETNSTQSRKWPFKKLVHYRWCFVFLAFVCFIYFMFLLVLGFCLDTPYFGHGVFFFFFPYSSHFFD